MHSTSQDIGFEIRWWKSILKKDGIFLKLSSCHNTYEALMRLGGCHNGVRRGCPRVWAFFLRIRVDLASIRTELGQYGQNCAILAGDRNKPKSALKHAETLRIH